MLTVKQINEVSFGRAGFSGYKPEDVDNFIDEVATSFQQLESERDEAARKLREVTAQNAALSEENAKNAEKLAALTAEVEKYRREEDGIKDALLSAQRLAKSSVKEAQEKADLIVQDAETNARQMMENAKVEAARAAKEYMAQAEVKREELEETKRQVSAFRSSLLEMYKKHLELINHIPNFRSKDRAEDDEPAPAAEEPAAEEPPVSQSDPQPVSRPEPDPKPVEAEPAKAEAEPHETEPAPVAAESRQPTLQDKVDYSREQPRPRREREDSYREDDLSEVGIDLKAYRDIPETLQREKSSNFSNLEFGDDVDLGTRRRKR